jgi:CzcA family heavy metal efflux pump
MQPLDHVIRWSIRNRLLTLIGGGAVVVAGFWAASRARLDALPDFTPPRVVVQTEARGLDTTDVEQLVTAPIERSLLGTPTATVIRSVSSPGLSVIVVTFADDVDVYRARQLVSERVTLVSGQLPPAANEPRLAPVSPPIGALLRFCLTTDRGVDGLRELRSFADAQIRQRLLAIPGVSQVTVHSNPVERIEVRPDPTRMRAAGTTLDNVLAAVRQAQTIAPAGFVENPTSRLDVVTTTRLTLDSAGAALSALAVAASNGRSVRLDQVAAITRGNVPSIGSALYDGRPAVFLQVNKIPGADTVSVSRELDRALAQLQNALPAGGRMEPPVMRQASFVRTSLISVGRAMAIGSILVVFVLIAFLRSGRLAAISLTAIPLSILAAVLVLVARGISINGMTLGGLAIAVGEVVDDAIVDVENVWRRLRENARSDHPRPALDVIHDASLEIRGSVVYASLIVMLVLIPVLLLGGVAGRIFSPLAQAYILAIGASLLVALTVTPAMCAWLLPHLPHDQIESTRLARRLLDRYRRILRAATARPRRVFIATGIAMVIALVALAFIGGSFLPEFHENTLIGEMNAPPGSSLDEIERVVRAVDTQVRPAAAIHTAARIGRAELDEDASPLQRIEMEFELRPDDHRQVDTISSDLSSRIARVPGVGFTVEGFLSERINEILSGETAPIAAMITGPELDELRALAAQATAQMQHVPGLSAIRAEPQIDVPRMEIRPDPLALSRYGILPSTVAEQASTWRLGTTATQISTPTGRIVAVDVVGTPDAQAWERIGDIPIETPRGELVALSNLAAIVRGREPITVQHENGVRRIIVGADARGAGVSRAVNALQNRLHAISVPPGYTIQIAGQSVARRSAGLRLLGIGALVLAGIFVLLFMAFHSLTDVAIVLLNFPLGLIGGVLGALLAPGGLSVAGFVGFITLFGIIARNGIMLVAHKRFVDETMSDLPPIERIHRAAEERLLPIVMTAATAGLGLLPLALSLFAAGSELEAPMAVIVIGGLISSTALNMIVLPTVYVWRERRNKTIHAA